MNTIARKTAALLVIIAFTFVTVGFCSCGNGQSSDEQESNGTVHTNPNDDGFGTEVGM